MTLYFLHVKACCMKYILLMYLFVRLYVIYLILLLYLLFKLVVYRHEMIMHATHIALLMYVNDLLIVTDDVSSPMRKFIFLDFLVMAVFLCYCIQKLSMQKTLGAL